MLFLYVFIRERFFDEKVLKQIEINIKNFNKFDTKENQKKKIFF